ncbi:MAG TPA: response regulator transcription factor [Bacteroidales bacterium]|nr:response regulator transcription factor [Bacteroidales bacterium]HRR92367.1 response regulator transcription factor [Bacteroidales bacterium]HRT89441.1 response regulator transcription factor [Bacteroidales bacterium]
MEKKDKKILIVDDEEDLCEILQYNLINEGYNTEIAHSAEEALKRSLEDFDLILLDVMMGNVSGFKFADILRKEKNIETPIIFLTAKDSENDILTGFSLGADDYIPKPFSINELSARVKAVLKRAGNEKKKQAAIVRFGEIELDTHRKRLIVHDEKVELTKKEYEILRLLLDNPGKVFSRENILEKVWGNDVIVTERTVDVNITRLRSKLGEYGSYLKNKTGYGYYIEF